MENKLLVTLINTGVVREGTEITVRRKGIDLGGTPNAVLEESFEIASYKKVKGIIEMIAFSTIDGKKYRVKASHVLSIDGMPPSRLVEAHKSEGKKRGRKSKKNK